MLGMVKVSREKLVEAKVFLTILYAFFRHLDME